MSASATEVSCEGVKKLGHLIQLAEGIQGVFGGRRQCPFVFPNGIVCDKAFAARYELKRHLRAHLGIRPHVCVYCTAARDAWEILGRTGKEPVIYKTVQKHNLTTHIERMHKSQGFALTQRPSKGFRASRRNPSSTDFNLWESGPHFLSPQSLCYPIGTAPSTTSCRPIHDAPMNTPPLYTPQGMHPILQNMASPFISAMSCSTCFSPYGCICQNIRYDALANPARQKIPSGVQFSAVYTPEMWPATSISAGSPPWGCSSGSSSGGYPTPSSDRSMFQGDLTHSPVRHPLGVYPGGHGPYPPLSPQIPRHEPYNCGQTIFCSSPQHPDALYCAANNSLGLLFPQPFTGSQRAACESTNPDALYRNNNIHAAPPFDDVPYTTGVKSTVGSSPDLILGALASNPVAANPTGDVGHALWSADNERAKMLTSHVHLMAESCTDSERGAIRDMKSDVSFTSYGELEPLTIDGGYKW